MTPVTRAIFAEAVGSLFLFATVIGSGIMAEHLSGGNVAIALLGNTLATGAILFVLITMLGPISGAHFNPAVTLVFRLKGEIGTGAAFAYLIAQLVGGILGVWLAHLMFDQPILEFSEKLRSGVGQWAAEGVATFGLLLTILGTIKARPQWVPASVALYITAAYWFTASTSFANPAVTLAHILTDTFAGIRPDDVASFLVAQVIGALFGLAVSRALLPNKAPAFARVTER
ncbi:MIP/aquaporin family protein [Sphingomonas sp.]|uniref:aquaporin n=1 Tax=Sphingomonas sp. TaxID=28214 RepID=UPI001EC29012|nr:MIP/aquaporin family protein [Sphingomonas sp.]MBX3594756.1 aquaporin family protein [Sphingomonas sp.]